MSIDRTMPLHKEICNIGCQYGETKWFNWGNYHGTHICLLLILFSYHMDSHISFTDGPSQFTMPLFLKEYMNMQPINS